MPSNGYLIVVHDGDRVIDAFHDENSEALYDHAEANELVKTWQDDPMTRGESYAIVPVELPTT